MIYIIIYILVTLSAYYFWKKTGEKNYLQISYLTTGALIVTVWDYGAKNFLHWGGSVDTINFYILILLRILILILVFFVMSKSLKKQNH